MDEGLYLQKPSGPRVPMHVAGHEQFRSRHANIFVRLEANIHVRAYSPAAANQPIELRETNSQAEWREEPFRADPHQQRPHRA